jgi:hypothetical protein
MGIFSLINLFRGCDAYMKGKIKEAVSTNQWKQGDSVVGMRINTDKAMEYLSKHHQDILATGDDPDVITFIIQEGMSHYKCELHKTELTEEGQSALMVYRSASN